MISIIVPIHNVEKYLPQCVESLINQTLKDIEIILVDDGSPDKSPEICDEYAEKDKRIVVVHQKNGGVSKARNAGLRIARGEFIGFVDPDDWTAPQMYESMLASLEDTGADLVVCGYEYCNEMGSIDVTRSYQVREDELVSQRDIMKRMSDMPPTIRHVVFNKLFRSDFLESSSFPEEYRASEDLIFLVNYLQKIHSCSIIHKPYYYNRIRNGSATHGGLSIHDLACSYNAHRFMYNSIVDLYPELKDYSQAFLLDVLLLKYNEAKSKIRLNHVSLDADKADISQMRKILHSEGIRGIFNKEIYWKTRLTYLLA